jgi:hypothetical protein
MAKFTQNTGKPLKEKIVSHVKPPFVVAFCRKLENNYTFSNLKESDLKKVQNFFNIASTCTVDVMDKKYRRKSDTQDKVDDLQVIHYGTSDEFRIHGIYINQRFEVIRIDTKHKKHKS